MDTKDIYKKLKSIVEPIHAHSDQLLAIASWIDSEFSYNKKTNKEQLICSKCKVYFDYNWHLEHDDCPVCGNDKGVTHNDLLHERWFKRWMEETGWYETADGEYDNSEHPNSCVRLTLEELFILEYKNMPTSTLEWFKKQIKNS